MRVAAVLVMSGLALIATVAQGHPGGFRPHEPLEIRHVGVAGGNPYTAWLSGGVIAFDGPMSDVALAFHVMVHDIRTRTTEDTGFLGKLACFDYPHLVIDQAEWQGDLNGDGDAEDFPVVVYDAVSRTGLAFAQGIQYGPACVSQGHIGYMRIEPYDQVDYNGDGDLRDQVAFLYDVVHGKETMLGTTFDRPYMVGRYAVWACAVTPAWTDLCIRDVVGGGERRAGFPGWGFPLWAGTDGVVFAFTTGFGASERLGYAILSTGELVMVESLGSVYGGSLQVSHGRILGAYGYGNAKLGHFLYDTATGATLNLPDLPPYNLQFHGDTILGNNWSNACICPPGEPPPWPSHVIAYDLVTREGWDIGLDGFLGDSIVGFDGETVIVASDERVAGEDVNRDGDQDDRLVMYATTGRLPPEESTGGLVLTAAVWPPLAFASVVFAVTVVPAVWVFLPWPSRTRPRRASPESPRAKS